MFNDWIQIYGNGTLSKIEDSYTKTWEWLRILDGLVERVVMSSAMSVPITKIRTLMKTRRFANF